MRSLRLVQLFRAAFSAPRARAIPCPPRGLACAALLFVAFVTILAMPLFGQTEATLSGVLADPSGAATPGASLTLTSQDTTAAIATLKSDASGNFSSRAVPAPGTYSVSVQVGGYARLEHKDIVVTASERTPLRTVALSVGTATESVTVETAVTPVQTEGAERSGSVDTHEIGDLLARGLNFNGIPRSLPGISRATDPDTPGEACAPCGSINGTRGSAPIRTMDGVMAFDLSSHGQLKQLKLRMRYPKSTLTVQTTRPNMAKVAKLSG